MDRQEKKHLVVLTGAGVSAESGIRTFRDDNGLWEGHDVMDVATPQGWQRNQELVLDFYNQRRKACKNAQPNPAHLKLAEMEKIFAVTIITQNVDDLHERGGSSRVIHLHGELFKAQSSLDPCLVYPMDGFEINPGDTCEKGSQLRPFVVWFGEPVPMMDAAISAVKSADAFAVIGTSLMVYPAAGLLDEAASEIPKFIVDPKMPSYYPAEHLIPIEEKAGKGVLIMEEHLKKWFFPD